MTSGLIRRRGKSLVQPSDSAVGGILPQIRGESLVFGETEGELQRERDLGCSSENGICMHGDHLLCG
ncbi:hypothetical protein NQZ68_021134 [Dissostichus eleginoides]|nr:hypothetical protein NQZ68_021134 [Dissostichus eleginoides]